MYSKRCSCIFVLSIGLMSVTISAAVDPIRPNQKLTPGATVTVTLQQVCTPGYTKTVRHVPASLSNAVYKEYGLVRKPHGYEIDHLISLELGGSNDIKNLWPQTYHGPWNATMKDQLENYLHRQVCTGQMSLLAAQMAIRTDWIATYQKAGLAQ